MVKNILLLLFVSICLSAVAQTPHFKLITTQYSRGLDSGREYIQFVVAAKQTCSETTSGDSIANIANYIIKDPNAALTFPLYGKTYPGIASGKYRFPNKAPWDSIGYGSVIIVYNHLQRNSNLRIKDDSTGGTNRYYVIPDNWLDSSFNSDSVPPTPDSILTTPPSLNLQAGQYCYLNTPIYPINNTTLPPPYDNLASNWSIGICDPKALHNNERPADFYGIVSDWVNAFRVVAVKTFNVSLEVQKPNIKDTANLPCPTDDITFFSKITLPYDVVSYEWDVNSIRDSFVKNKIDSSSISSFTLTIIKNLHHNDTVSIRVSTSLKCIAGHKVGDTATKIASFVRIPAAPLATTITPTPAAITGTDSLATITDTLGVVHLDSAHVYMSFCKGTKVTFRPIANQPTTTDNYLWYKNGTHIINDSIYTDSSLKNGDSIVCILHSSINRCIDTHDTTVIRLTIFDSIPISTVTISTSNLFPCSNGTDTIMAVFSTDTIKSKMDTSARYQLQWYVEGNFAYQDPITYHDTDGLKKIYVVPNFGGVLGNLNINALLLAKKTQSCPYATTFTLLDTSNTLQLHIIPAITPSVIISTTQNGLCPFPQFPKDSILFTATGSNDSIPYGKKAIYRWYVNSKEITDSTVLTFNTDTSTYASNAILSPGDTVSVLMVDTSYKCFTQSDSTTYALPMSLFNPYPPVLSTSVSPNPPSICALYNTPVVFTNPTSSNLNTGIHPKYQWLVNGVDSTDPANPHQYTYYRLRNKDTVSFILTSSIACAQFKTDTVVIPIVVTNANTASINFSPTSYSICEGAPLVLSPTIVEPGNSPTYDVYVNNVLSQTISQPTVFGLNAGFDSIFFVMHSSVNCLANKNDTSNTIYVTIHPAPQVNQISGDQNICKDAYKIYSETTLGGQWTTSPSGVLMIDSLGVFNGIETAKVTGLSLSSASVVYTVRDSVSGCTNVASIFVNISTTSIPMDSMIYKYRCTSASMNADTIFNASSQGNWIFDPNMVQHVKDSSFTDINGVFQYMGIFTVLQNGVIYITDSIYDAFCGTTMRYDTIVVGPPIIDSVTGNKPICTLGMAGALQLRAYVKGDTSRNWVSSNPSIATVDNTGLVTGVSNGTTTITFTIFNACTGIVSPIDTIIQITVGPPPPPNISPTSLTVCTNYFNSFSFSPTGGVWKSADTSIAKVDALTGKVLGGAKPGTVNMTYTFGSSFTCGTDSSVAQVTVNAAPPPQPITAANNDSIVCNSSTLQLSCVSTGSTFQWISSNPTIAAIDQNGLVSAAIYPANGVVIISYAAFNGSCGSDTVQYVIIIGAPIIQSLAYQNPICVNDTVKINSILRGVTLPVKWNSLDETVIHVIDHQTGLITGVGIGGTADIQLKIGNRCVQLVDSTFSITVNPLPVVPPIVGKTKLCLYDTTTYTNTATKGKWSSSTSAISIDSTTGFVKAINAGTTTISYKVLNQASGCKKVDSLILAINAIPKLASINGTGSIFCTNRIVTLSDDTLGGFWRSSDTTIARVSNKGNVFGIKSGKANIIYGITDGNGCKDSVVSAITVNTTPVVAPIVAAKDTLCVKDTITYTDITKRGVWYSSDTSVVTVNAAGLVTGVKAGFDSIMYKVTDPLSGCFDSARQTISIDSIPFVAPIQGAGVPFCNGRIVPLSDSIIGGTWKSDNNSIAVVTSSGNVLGISPGTTNIDYTIIGGKLCSNTVKVPVTINAIPAITPIVGVGKICVGETTPFTSTPMGGIWSSASPLLDTVSNVGMVTALMVTRDTIDTISYRVVIKGCDTTVSKTVLIQPKPTLTPITYVVDSVHKGLTILLSDTTLQGTWTSLSPDTATVSNGTVTGVFPGKAAIVYTIQDAAGCKASDTVLITVLNPLNDIYVPNFFNPYSANKENQTFMVLGKLMSAVDFKVFSPWGALMYHTNDINAAGWDGKFNGQEMPTGVYVYTARITVKDVTGKVSIINKKGAVNLIR